MNLTDSEAAELLKALAPEMRKPGDIDVTMAVAMWGIKRTAAQARLEVFVEDGILTKHPDVYDPDTGRKLTVYRKK